MAEGRPTDYTFEMAIAVCEWIAEGKSLQSCAKQDGMPHISTVYRWLNAHAEFREMYTRAKEDSADALADQILDIADDSKEDFVSVMGENDDGTPIATAFNSEHVQRSKLRVEARKWIAAKLKPRKYGEKITQELEGKIGVEVTEIVRKIIK